MQYTLWSCGDVYVCSSPSRIIVSKRTNLSSNEPRYCDDNLPSTANLFDDADNQLFRNILANGEHRPILHHYMPQRTTLSHCRHYLRPSKHNKELIPKTRTLNNKDFIVHIRICTRPSC